MTVLTDLPRFSSILRAVPNKNSEVNPADLVAGLDFSNNSRGLTKGGLKEGFQNGVQETDRNGSSNYPILLSLSHALAKARHQDTLDSPGDGKALISSAPTTQNAAEQP